MSAKVWQAILSAWSAMDATIVTALPSGQVDVRYDVEARLEPLHESLMSQLTQLITRLRSLLLSEARQKLANEDGSVPATSPKADASEAQSLAAREVDDEVQQMIEPLAMHLDERVLGRLPPRVSPSWSRLQETVLNSDDGGGVFFQKLDALLDAPHPSPLVLEVYLFCLQDGFFGQYLDEPENIVRYKYKIEKRLPQTSAPLMRVKDGGAAGGPLATTETPKVLPPAAYYAIAGGLALGIILLLRALAG